MSDEDVQERPKKRRVSFPEDLDEYEGNTTSLMALEDAAKEREIRERFLKSSEKLISNELDQEEDEEEDNEFEEGKKEIKDENDEKDGGGEEKEEDEDVKPLEADEKVASLTSNTEEMVEEVPQPYNEASDNEIEEEGVIKEIPSDKEVPSNNENETAPVEDDEANNQELIEDGSVDENLGSKPGEEVSSHQTPSGASLQEGTNEDRIERELELETSHPITGALDRTVHVEEETASKENEENNFDELDVIESERKDSETLESKSSSGTGSEKEKVEKRSSKTGATTINSGHDMESEEGENEIENIEPGGDMDSIKSGSGLETRKKESGIVNAESGSEMQATKSGSGLEVAKISSGMQVEKSDSGTAVAKSSSGMQVEKSGSGVEVAKSSSGMQVEKSGSGVEVAKSSSGMQVTKNGSGVEVAKSSSGMQVTKSGSGVEVAKSSSGMQVTKSGSGVEVAKSSSGMQVEKSGSGVEVAKSSSGMQVTKSGSSVEVAKSSSGMQVTKSGSGIAVIKSGKGVEVAKSSSGMQVTKSGSGVEVAKSSSGMQVPKSGSGIAVAKSGSGLEVAKSSSGIAVTKSGSGVEVAKSSSGMQVTKSGSGVEVAKSSSGMQVTKSGSGIAVAKSGSGLEVAKSSSGMHVTKSGSGVEVVKSSSGMQVTKSGSGVEVAKSNSGMQVEKSNSGMQVEKSSSGLQVQKSGSGIAIANSSRGTGVAEISSGMQVAKRGSGTDPTKNFRGMDFIKSLSGVEAKKESNGVDGAEARSSGKPKKFKKESFKSAKKPVTEFATNKSKIKSEKEIRKEVAESESKKNTKMGFQTMKKHDEPSHPSVTKQNARHSTETDRRMSAEIFAADTLQDLSSGSTSQELSSGSLRSARVEKKDSLVDVSKTQIRSSNPVFIKTSSSTTFKRNPSKIREEREESVSERPSFICNEDHENREEKNVYDHSEEIEILRRSVEIYSPLFDSVKPDKVSSLEKIKGLSDDKKLVMSTDKWKSFSDLRRLESQQALLADDDDDTKRRIIRHAISSILPPSQKTKLLSSVQPHPIEESPVDDLDYPLNENERKRSMYEKKAPLVVELAEDIMDRRHTLQDTTGFEKMLLKDRDIKEEEGPDWSAYEESKKYVDIEKIIREAKPQLPVVYHQINQLTSVEDDEKKSSHKEKVDLSEENEEERAQRLLGKILTDAHKIGGMHEASELEISKDGPSLFRIDPDMAKKGSIRMRPTGNLTGASDIASPLSDAATIDTHTHASVSSFVDSFSSDVISEFSTDERYKENQRKRKKLNNSKKKKGSEHSSSPPSTDMVSRRHTDVNFKKSKSLEIEKKYSLDQKLKAVKGIGNEHQESIQQLAKFMAPLVRLDDEISLDIDSSRPSYQSIAQEEPVKPLKASVRITEPVSKDMLIYEDNYEKSSNHKLKETQEILISHLTHPQLEAFEFLFYKINRPYMGGIDWKKLYYAFEEYSPQTIISERDAAIIVQELDDNRSGRIEFSDFISLMTRPNIFKKVLLRQDLKYLEAELKVWEDITSHKYKFTTDLQVGSRSMRCRSLFLILVRKIIVHYTLREIRIFYFNVITKLNDLAIEALLKDKHRKDVVTKKLMKNQRLLEGETARQHRIMLKDFTKNLPPDRIARKETLIFKRMLKKRYPQMPDFELTLRTGADESGLEYGDLILSRGSDSSISQGESAATSRRRKQRGSSVSTRKTPQGSLFSYLEPKLGDYPAFNTPSQINPAEVDYVVDIKQKASQTKQEYFDYLRRTASANAQSLANLIEFEHQKRRFTQVEEYGTVPKKFMFATTGSVLPDTKWRPKAPIKVIRRPKPKPAWV